MDFKIPFALNSNAQLVSRALAIKNDQYICPNCNEPIIVREGAIITKHFAHKISSKCSYDSVIHNLAQRIIKEYSQISVEDGKIEYTNPQTEFTIGNYRTDALLETSRYGKLIVEVAVTHPLDERKLDSLLKGYNVLEIDLSTWRKIDPDLDTFASIVLHEANRMFYKKETTPFETNDLNDMLILGLVGAGIGFTAYAALKRLRARR